MSTEIQINPELVRLKALRDSHLMDTPLEERFERVTRLAQRMFRTPIAALSLVDADRQWFKSIQGINMEGTSREVAFCGHTIMQDDVLVVPDARLDPRFCDNPLVAGSPHIVFYAGCPVRAMDGSRIASLCVIDGAPRDLTREDIQMLRDLAAVTESEINANMQSGAQQELLAEMDQLSRETQVDPLTRIWNRTSIFDLLDTELARARRAGTGVGVIMADLDFFKRVNDTLGHAAGDEVLRQTVKRMLGSTRDTDALGRYGGEEFLLVLGQCQNLSDAQAVAQRITGRMAESPFETEAGQTVMTMSMGVAFCGSAAGITGQMLIQAADEMLYRAKNEGRNRHCSVIVESPLCETIITP